jgi:hypothetical protein
MWLFLCFKNIASWFVEKIQLNEGGMRHRRLAGHFTRVESIIFALATLVARGID